LMEQKKQMGLEPAAAKATFKNHFSTGIACNAAMTQFLLCSSQWFGNSKWTEKTGTNGTNHDGAVSDICCCSNNDNNLKQNPKENEQ